MNFKIELIRCIGLHDRIPEIAFSIVLHSIEEPTTPPYILIADLATWPVKWDLLHDSDHTSVAPIPQMLDEVIIPSILQTFWSDEMANQIKH